MNKSYHGLIQFSTFEERFEYLKLNGAVAAITFGYDRYLNQMLYQSREWKRLRHDVIFRDEGCDLGIPDREIHSQILIHHITPITLESIEYGDDCVFDMENLITTTKATHNAIHYGDSSLLVRLPEKRRQHDTCLWHR